MRIYLCKVVNTPRSIEAGKHDGVNHFDHHGQFEGMAAPCKASIQRKDANVTISHMDADTLVGLVKMCDIHGWQPIPAELDLDLMELIDLNGSTVAPSRFDPTLLWMVGVGAVARMVEFPRCGEEPIDVTNLIHIMMGFDFFQEGEKAQKASEEAYERCVVKTDGKVCLAIVGEDDEFDPSRPYTDDYEIVVVYRTHYESISIYCDPSSKWVFGGTRVAGIEFAGHPKACGSPRGESFNRNDAEKVFETAVKISKGIKDGVED